MNKWELDNFYQQFRKIFVNSHAFFSPYPTSRSTNYIKVKLRDFFFTYLFEIPCATQSMPRGPSPPLYALGEKRYRFKITPSIHNRAIKCPWKYISFPPILYFFLRVHSLFEQRFFSILFFVQNDGGARTKTAVLLSFFFFFVPRFASGLMCVSPPPFFFPRAIFERLRPVFEIEWMNRHYRLFKVESDFFFFFPLCVWESIFHPFVCQHRKEGLEGTVSVKCCNKTLSRPNNVFYIYIRYLSLPSFILKNKICVKKRVIHY